jgi:transposase
MSTQDAGSKEDSDEEHRCDDCGQTFETERGLSIHQNRSEDADKPWKDPELLATLYVERELGQREIADMLGCSQPTIRVNLDKHDIERSHPWRDGDKLQHLYVDEGLSMETIADRFGCNFSTVYDWIERLEIERPEPWNDKETLRRLYVDDGLSSREIATELGCSKTTTLDRLGEFKIERRPTGGVEEFPQLHDEDWLREEYAEKHRTVGALAEEIGCSQPAVSRVLNKFGIPQRGSKIPFPVSEDELVRMYVEDERTLHSLGEDFDVDYWTVRNRLVDLDIEIRTERRGWPFGKDHRWWKGGWDDYYGPTWDAQKEKERRLAGYQCRVCGMSDESHIAAFGSRLPVHHIIRKEDFRKENGELDYEAAHTLENLMCLCKPHHREWEGIPLRPQFV